MDAGPIFRSVGTRSPRTKPTPRAPGYSAAGSGSPCADSITIYRQTRSKATAAFRRDREPASRGPTKKEKKKKREREREGEREKETSWSIETRLGKSENSESLKKTQLVRTAGKTRARVPSIRRKRALGVNEEEVSNEYGEMTSCAILFFSFSPFYISFPSSFFLFSLRQRYVFPWTWSFLIQTRDRLKGFAQEGYSISSSSSISLPPAFTLSSPQNLPAPLFSLLELLKTRKSKNREARPTKGDLSFFDPRLSADSMALPPISLSLSLSAPLSTPFSSLVKVLLLRSPPFSFSRVFLLSSITDFYPGFLTPFFPSAAT